MMIKKILSWLVIGTGAIAVASILHSLDWGPAWQRVIAQEKPKAAAGNPDDGYRRETPNAKPQRAPASDSDPFVAVPSNEPTRPVPSPRHRDNRLPTGSRIRRIERPVTENGTTRWIEEDIAEIDPNFAKKQELNASIRTEIQNYQTTKSEESRTEVETRLSQSLGQLFDLQQAEREAQLKPMEERIKKLRETLTKRAALRDDLIKLRLTVLLQDADGLGWGAEDEFLPRPVSMKPIPANATLAPVYNVPAEIPVNESFDAPLTRRVQKRDSSEDDLVLPVNKPAPTDSSDSAVPNPE